MCSSCVPKPGSKEPAIIISGSRVYQDEEKITFWMAKVVAETWGTPAPEPIRVIHGGAKGADEIGERVAKRFMLPVTVYPAHWKEFGKAAGMMRNRQMLDDWPDAVVLAFPLGESKGTRGMIKEALRRGMKVYVVEEEHGKTDD